MAFTFPLSPKGLGTFEKQHVDVAEKSVCASTNSAAHHLQQAAGIRLHRGVVFVPPPSCSRATCAHTKEYDDERHCRSTDHCEIEFSVQSILLCIES